MFNKAVVAILALFALSLPAAAQEPSRTERAVTLIADTAWNASEVDQYLNLFGTQEGRVALLPATSQSAECERQVAALDSLRLLLQRQPSIGEHLTEYRLAGMREHAVQLGACGGLVAQIDRITVVRRTLVAATTTTQVATTGATCNVTNWRWDNPVCASATSASTAGERYVSFFEGPATQCQISTVMRIARSQGWESGVMMARHYLDLRFDGRVLDEATCGRIVVASAG